MPFLPRLWLLYCSANALKAIITVESISYWLEDSRIAFFESLEYSEVSTLNELPRILVSKGSSTNSVPSLKRDFEKVKLDKGQCTWLVEYFLNKPEYHGLVLPFPMVYSNPELVLLIRPNISLYRPTELKLLKTAFISQRIFSHNEMLHFLTLLGSHPEYCQDSRINNMIISFIEFTRPWELIEFNNLDFFNYPLVPETNVFGLIMRYSSDKRDVASFYGDYPTYKDEFEAFELHLDNIRFGFGGPFNKWKSLNVHLERVMSQWKLSEYRQIWWKCRLTLTVMQLTTNHIKSKTILLYMRHVYCVESVEIFIQLMSGLIVEEECLPQYLIEEMLLLIKSWNLMHEVHIPANVIKKLIHLLPEFDFSLFACDNLQVSLASWRVTLRRLSGQLKPPFTGGGVNLLDISRVIPIDEFLNRWASFDKLYPQIIRQPVHFRVPLILEDSERRVYEFYGMESLLEYLTQYYWSVLRINDIICKREALDLEEKWLVRGFGRLLASNLYHRGHFGIALHLLQQDELAYLPFADYEYYIKFIDLSVDWPFGDKRGSDGYKMLNQILYQDLRIDRFITVDTLRAADMSESWQRSIQVIMNPLAFILFLLLLFFTF